MSNVSQNVQAVLDQVYRLYFNPDVSLKEKASKWLEEFQSSPLAWDVSNQLLCRIPQNANEVPITYFAAQTLRTKIMKSLKEVPETALESLKSSLLEHVERLCHISPVIATQLALGICDLAVQMPSWRLPAVEFIQKYHDKDDAFPYLLEILQLLPEEINNDSLRLGDNRRKELLEDMENSAPMVLDLLKACLDGVTDERLLVKILKSLASWFLLGVLPGNHVARQRMLDPAFNILQNAGSSSSLHDAATQCLCSALYSVSDVEKQFDLVAQLKQGTYLLQSAYHNALAHEDLDKCIDLCQIFSELAETLAVPLVESPGRGLGDMNTVELLLMCAGHHQYEVAEITFNVWYRIGDMLEPNPDNESPRRIFTPFIERLIVALVRHCQMEPDQEKMLDEDDDFFQFRRRAADFVRDVARVIDVTNCFVRLFMLLTGNGSARDWDVMEAILFIMSALAPDVSGDETEIIPQLLIAIASMAADVHIALRHTGVDVLGKLGRWMKHNPQVVESALMFLKKTMEVPQLATVTAQSLSNICDHCKEHLAGRRRDMVDLIHAAEAANVSPEAALCLIQGAVIVIRQNDFATIKSDVSEICQLVTEKLTCALQSQAHEGRKEANDPETYLDRYAAIFQFVTLDTDRLGGAPHPCRDVVGSIWNVLALTLETYKDDNKIVERWCRCVRYIVRCLKKSTPHAMVTSIIASITSAYATHPHSCFLYLGSILVDELQSDPSLLAMLTAFAPAAFRLLHGDQGLQTHPCTVDDLFRLCCRFMEHLPAQFLSHEICPALVECAVTGLYLVNRDANNAITKFLATLIDSRHSDGMDIVGQVVSLYGEQIVARSLNAVLFEIPSFLYPNIGDIWWALMQRNRQAFSDWLKAALRNLPTEVSLASATPDQCAQFHAAVTSVSEEKEVGYHIRDFCRLFR